MSSPLVIAPEPQPVAAVVDLLEHLLAQAKIGELREIAIASRVTGCRIATAHVGETGEDVFRMLGAVTLLSLRVGDGIER